MVAGAFDVDAGTVSDETMVDSGAVVAEVAAGTVWFGSAIELAVVDETDTTDGLSAAPPPALQPKSVRTEHATTPTNCKFFTCEGHGANTPRDPNGCALCNTAPANSAHRLPRTLLSRRARRATTELHP